MTPNLETQPALPLGKVEPSKPKRQSPMPAWIRILRDPLSKYEVEAANKLNGEMNGPQAVADFLRSRAESEENEVFYVLLLNRKNRLVGCVEATRGTVDATVVDARAVFRAAIAYNAVSVILAHNHPSGDPTPSREDIALTKELAKAGDILHVTVLDHVIIGGNGNHVSHKELGLL